MIPPKQVPARCMLHAAWCRLHANTHHCLSQLRCDDDPPAQVLPQLLHDRPGPHRSAQQRDGALPPVCPALAWSHCAAQHPVCRWSVWCEERCSGQAARNARDAACDMHDLKRATHDMRHEQHATQQHNSMRHASPTCSVDHTAHDVQRAGWMRRRRSVKTARAPRQPSAIGSRMQLASPSDTTRTACDCRPVLGIRIRMRPSLACCSTAGTRPSALRRSVVCSRAECECHTVRPQRKEARAGSSRRLWAEMGWLAA